MTQTLNELFTDVLFDLMQYLFHCVISVIISW